MLPRIVDAVGDKLDIFFDSGIRCGADVAKAMALGGKMCLIGRPYVYGLALGGGAGVSHILKSLLGDLELMLHLAGIKSTDPSQLNRCVAAGGYSMKRRPKQIRNNALIDRNRIPFLCYIDRIDDIVQNEYPFSITKQEIRLRKQRKRDGRGP